MSWRGAGRRDAPLRVGPGLAATSSRCPARLTSCRINPFAPDLCNRNVPGFQESGFVAKFLNYARIRGRQPPGGPYRREAAGATGRDDWSRGKSRCGSSGITVRSGLSFQRHSTRLTPPARHADGTRTPATPAASGARSAAATRSGEIAFSAGSYTASSGAKSTCRTIHIITWLVV